MEKKIYTKQELVDKAVETCKAIIRSEVANKGYISLEEYHSDALYQIDALWYLDIIDENEWGNLRHLMNVYRRGQNELSAKMDGEL